MERVGTLAPRNGSFSHLGDLTRLSSGIWKPSPGQGKRAGMGAVRGPVPLHSSEGWMESRVRGGHHGLCPELGSLPDMESGGGQGRATKKPHPALGCLAARKNRLSLAAACP